MRLTEQNVELPYRKLGPVFGGDELVAAVTRTFDLLSPDTLVSERVFASTHRLVAENSYVPRYTEGPQRYSSSTRSKELFDLVQPQIEWLKTVYPTARPFVIQCATLPPGKKLLWHIDCYLYQSLSHKVHIPICTNDDAFYEYLDGRTPNKVHFEVGQAYEINNIWMHRSSNSGTTARAHVIIDMLEQEGFDLLDRGIDIVFTHHEANKQAEVEYWK